MLAFCTNTCIMVLLIKIKEEIKMLNLNCFRSPANEVSVFKNIPMDMLDLVRDRLKSKGLKITVRYRGPRPASPGRYKCTAQSTCLIKDATRFSVYLRTNAYACI